MTRAVKTMKLGKWGRSPGVGVRWEQVSVLNSVSRMGLIEMITFSKRLEASAGVGCVPIRRTFKALELPEQRPCLECFWRTQGTGVSRGGVAGEVRGQGLGRPCKAFGFYSDTVTLIHSLLCTWTSHFTFVLISISASNASY